MRENRFKTDLELIVKGVDFLMFNGSSLKPLLGLVLPKPALGVFEQSNFCTSTKLSTLRAAFLLCF